MPLHSRAAFFCNILQPLPHTKKLFMDDNMHTDDRRTSAAAAPRSPTLPSTPATVRTHWLVLLLFAAVILLISVWLWSQPASRARLLQGAVAWLPTALHPILPSSLHSASNPAPIHLPTQPPAAIALERQPIQSAAVMPSATLSGLTPADISSAQEQELDFLPSSTPVLEPAQEHGGASATELPTPNGTMPDHADAAIRHTLRPWVHPQTPGWMQEHFIRRFVTTVDNLPSERAPTALWPVQPTAPPFTVEESPPDAYNQRLQWIGARNHLRYATAMWFVQHADVTEAVRHYRQHYPHFQQAYEALGYPGRQFHDRLLEVIDHLLQTPEPDAPPRVQLMPVHGSVVSLQPWVRYEFEDAQLEARSSGQKILLRMGVDHTRTIKSRLRELRTALHTQPPPGRPASMPPR